MPILDIELILAPGETPVSDLAARLADAAGEALGSPPGGTWVKLRFVEADLYAENGGAPQGLCPVFVSVLKSSVPAGEAIESEIARLTSALAAVCDRPVENVHLVYQPAAAGRVAFGGKLVRP